MRPRARTPPPHDAYVNTTLSRQALGPHSWYCSRVRSASENIGEAAMMLPPSQLAACVEPPVLLDPPPLRTRTSTG